MNLRQQKIYHNKVIDILHRTDSLSIELDAELAKSKEFDRLSLILAGVSAMLSTLIEQIQLEIVQSEERLRLEHEFNLLYKAEQEKFERKSRIKPPLKINDDTGPALLEGM